MRLTLDQSKLINRALVIISICAIIFGWVVPLYQYQKFMSNGLNDKLVRRSPNWNTDAELEVRDVFPSKSTFNDFVLIADNAGFKCNNSIVRTADARSIFCSQRVPQRRWYGFCTHWIGLAAVFDNSHKLASVAARYSSQCLW